MNSKHTVLSYVTSLGLQQFAAVVNEKKQKLRELQQRIQELEEQAEEGPDQVCCLAHYRHL